MEVWRTPTPDFCARRMPQLSRPYRLSMLLKIGCRIQQKSGGACYQLLRRCSEAREPVGGDVQNAQGRLFIPLFYMVGQLSANKPQNRVTMVTIKCFTVLVRLFPVFGNRVG